MYTIWAYDGYFEAENTQDMIILWQRALNQGRFESNKGGRKAERAQELSLGGRLRGAAGPSETLISCSTTVYLFRDLSTPSKVPRLRSGQTLVEC